MNALKGGWEPLSVRRGIREPFRLVDGIPSYARPLFNSWTIQALYDLNGDYFANIQQVITTLRIETQATTPEQLVVRLTDDNYLDLLDLLVRTAPARSHELEAILRLAGSVWRVDREDRALRSFVPLESVAAYELALKKQPTAAEHLSGAWEHAFGRNPDAGDAWSDAIKAIEAVLSPIVIPDAKLAKLSDIQSAVRSAPPGKFIIRAAGRDAQASLVGMLDAITYEPGRHGSDTSVPDLATARIAVLQSTAIVAGVGEGLIERPDA